MHIKFTFSKDIRTITDMATIDDVRRYGFWRILYNHIAVFASILYIKMQLPRIRDIITKGKWSRDRRNHSGGNWNRDGRS